MIIILKPEQCKPFSRETIIAGLPRNH